MLKHSLALSSHWSSSAISWLSPPAPAPSSSYRHSHSFNANSKESPQQGAHYLFQPMVFRSPHLSTDGFSEPTSLNFKPSARARLTSLPSPSNLPQNAQAALVDAVSAKFRRLASVYSAPSALDTLSFGLTNSQHAHHVLVVTANDTPYCIPSSACPIY